MGFKTPTSRKSKKPPQRINLIPILDAVFIFIFFLLMSTQFIKVYEISSKVPILSNSPPPKKQKKQLALTVIIKKSGFVVSHGLPSKVAKSIRKTNGEYNLIALHDYLLNLKKRYINEELVILEPVVDLKYDILINIMDSIRMINNTDGPLFKKDAEGIDVQVKTLFSKIVFGNLMS